MNNRSGVARALVALTLAVVVAGCNEPPSPPSAAEPVELAPPNHAEYFERLQNAGLSDSLVVQRWLRGAHAALRTPTDIRLPHEERGAFVPHDIGAVGLAFDVLEGQTLRAIIDQSDDSSGRLFAQLFYIDPLSVTDRFQLVATLTDTAGDNLQLARTGRYVLRLQPELHAAIDYRVRLELDAALPFPVSGHTLRSVRSFFGDVRDAGRRRHEGIDVFARRNTPVVAVVDGIAMPRQSERGGNTVWLRGTDRSFYFAHLETVAIEYRQRVRAGDVLGYVGNTGNARTTPPHLHFGIYRRGLGAIDPFPYFESLTFSEEPRDVGYEPGFVEITDRRARLRPKPVTVGSPLAELETGAVVAAKAVAGDWLRVERGDGTAGWVRRRYQQAASAEAQLAVFRDSWLRAAPDGLPIARLHKNQTVHRFGADSIWVLVGLTEDKPLGWVRMGKAW